MELVTTRVQMTRLPMRQLGVLALIAILIAAALAAYIGSQQRRLPAPFGPAANGLIPFEQDGDIYVGDLDTGQTRLLVSGPENDRGASFSSDGTRIGFIRDVRLGEGVVAADIHVMDPDGSDLRRVTARPIRDLVYANWTPDGRLAIVHPVAGPGCAATSCSINQLDLLEVDGSGRSVRLAAAAGIDQLAFRPPTGDEILFRAFVDGKFGLYSIHLDGADLRTIIEPRFGRDMDMDLTGAVYSADGERIFYSHATDSGCCQLWTVTADGKDPKPFAASSSAWDGLGVVSPDGTRIAYWHHPNEGPVHGVTVARTDGTGPVVEIGPIVRDTVQFVWSPDSSKILLWSNDGTSASAYLLDPDGGEWTTVPWRSGPDLDWQRKALE
jgi:hypothetical protein